MTEALADISLERRYYITFGQRYRTQTHPKGEWIQPSGYVVIIADNEDAARAEANDFFGKENWAFIYDHLDLERGRFNPQIYPDGILAVLLADSKGNNHG